MATTVRISGDIGTTERESGRTKTRPYKRATAPSARLVGTSITASVPTERQRERRALINAQQSAPERKRRKRSTSVSALNVVSSFTGTTPNGREIMYTVNLRVRGAGTFQQTMDYPTLNRLWNEHYGENYTG